MESMSALQDAIRNGDLWKLKQLIAEEVDVAERNSLGHTVLS
jgi:hypothetical protein